MSVAYKLQDSAVVSTVDCSVFDVKFLDRNTFGDKVLRDEIIGLFLAQLDGVLRNFATPIDQTAWQFLTHTLKGSASAVGAGQIAALAEVWDKSEAPVTVEQRKSLQNQLLSLTSEFRAILNRL